MIVDSSKNLDNPPVTGAAILEISILGLLVLLLVGSLYLVGHPGFWLKYYKVMSTGLNSIATVKDLHGQVSRKTSIDSMWLPLVKKNPIFDVDQVVTEFQSEAEIEFGTNLLLMIKENSKLRIGSIEGEVNLRLSQGEVQVNALKDQNIHIQRGADVEVLFIRRGFYSLKIDPLFGVQFSSAAGPPKFEKTGKIQNKSLAAKKNENIKASEVKADGKEDPPQPETLRKKQSYALPTPKDTTVFLGYQKQEIVVAAKRICPDACNLKIFKDHKLWKEQEFKSGEQSVVRLTPKEMGIGIYDWMFSTETAEFRSRFVVKEFTDDELFRALENKLPVEIQ